MHLQLAEDLRLEMQRQEHAEEIAVKNRSARDTALFTENYCRLREQWLLRGLLRHRSTTTIAELLEKSPSRQRRVLEALKVIAPAAPLPTEVAIVQAALAQRWAPVRNAPPVERRGRPFTHLAALGQELGLTAVEQDVLLFALMLRGDPVLSSGMEALGEVNEYEVREVLAVAACNHRRVCAQSSAFSCSN